MPVGFDIGNSSCFVAVARQGGIETIDNEYSARMTPAFISFNEKNRSIGVSAKNQCITNLKNTVSTFKRFIGRKFSDPFVQNELKNYPKPYKVEEGKNGEIFIKVRYMDQEHQFTPEQLMGALLTKLRHISEAGLKTKVVDVVVSVPTFFTDIERRAMLASCEIAGLNCMKVMNDSTAAALGYGIYKQDLPPESEKARNIVFVDMGYCSLQVAIVAFHKTKLKVLATNFDPCLGGRDFDKIIADYFAQDFKERYKIDVQKNLKARLRLETECEKLKKLMSANTQAIPINIECFMDDKDVTGRMDRAKFEELSASLLNRIEAVFKELLDFSKASKSDIAGVEIVGGSSRVPVVKSLVQKVFGIEPSTTLNADEAVARGCSLQNAILNPTFRVRDFSINDAQPYSITLSWQATMEEDSSMELFPKFHVIPMSKVLTFYRTEPFTLEAKYTHPNDVKIPDTLIGTFQVKNVEKPKNEDSAKLKVKVRVNHNGIFNVTSATLSETVEQEEEAKTNEQAMEVENEKKNKEEEKTAESTSTGEQSQVNGETEERNHNASSPYSYSTSRRPTMKFSVFICSLILVVIMNTNFGMCQRPILKCPQYIYRLFASQTFCNSTHVSYICVKNMNDDTYMDICETQPERSRKGRRVVWRGNLDTVECQTNRYQPMIFNTNDTNECVYIKSTCNEIGQFIANFGSTKDDVACGCDNAEGYTFIQRRKNNTCVPSFEDCSCYDSNLPKSDVLPLNFLEVDNKNQIDNVLMSDRSRIILESEGREKESAFTKDMQTLSRQIATGKKRPPKTSIIMITLFILLAVMFSIMAMCLLLVVETKRFQESLFFKLSIFSAMMTTAEKNTGKKLRKDSADSETKTTSDKPCRTHLVGGNKVVRDEINKMMGMSSIQGLSEKCNHFENEVGKLFGDATSQFAADITMKKAQEMKNSLDHVEHIILLLIDFDNNSNTDLKTLKENKKYLWETFENQIIVLFTHNNQIEGNRTDDTWLKSHPNMREIFSEIFKNEKSVFIFNLKCSEREAVLQVKCLKALIEYRTCRNVLQLL